MSLPDPEKSQAARLLRRAALCGLELFTVSRKRRTALSLCFDAIPDGKPFRTFPGIALVASLALVSACTVRPLYSSAPLTTGSNVGTSADLASISIKPVGTRYGQQVRNNLIFAFGQGSGEPASPAYTLDLGVSELIESAAIVQVQTEEDEPTAGTVTLTANYVLRDATGAVVAVGKRSIPSSFDRPRQEFAAYRAQIDAENRAARELADLLRLAIAQDLAKHGKKA